ncbi:MAG: hypothetical protein WC455_21070 [Dehalococcoidia bacterium]|jgi:hypothetical protein
MPEELLKIIEALETIACSAYWSNHSDCGADFNASCCKPCSNYQVCQAVNTIEKIKKGGI